MIFAAFLIYLSGLLRELASNPLLGFFNPKDDTNRYIFAFKNTVLPNKNVCFSCNINLSDAVITQVQIIHIKVLNNFF